MSEKRKKPVDQLLAKSFKELACQQPIEKITIRQITDRAGVIRPTFYNHFEDKYKLLEWILIHDILVPIQPLIENGMVSEAMRLIFYNLRKEKAFYESACRLEGQDSFRSMVERGLSEILCDVIREQMKQRKPHNPWLTPEHLAAYYASSMTFVVISWIESGMELTPEQLTEVYTFIINRSLADVLKDIEWDLPDA